MQLNIYIQFHVKNDTGFHAHIHAIAHVVCTQKHSQTKKAKKYKTPGKSQQPIES
jgi:hypothetical protein